MRTMPGRTINLIVIHCSASKNGVRLADGTRTAARVIDGWHGQRGFHRSPVWRAAYNSHFGAIGYHFVIDTDGTIETGRDLDEIGAHVEGHNHDSIGICCVGYDSLTRDQWRQLRAQVTSLVSLYPAARVVGHRDLSPDLNHDGRITPNEYSKTCPGFNAIEWYNNGMQPVEGHIV